MKKRFMRCCALTLSLLMIFSPTAFAQIIDQDLRDHVQAKNGGILSLAQVPVPAPNAANLAKIVVNQDKAIMLGKALFWDMQAGGDGQTACASCHFHSGADSRARNQISPGLLGGDTTFGAVGFSDVTGPNYTLKAADFPFPKELNDVVSSQGVFMREFAPGVFNPADACTAVTDPDGFRFEDLFNTRKVEPRNTPTTINAVFNHRNFWDGRANNAFNGQNPDGVRAGATVAVMNSSGGVDHVELVHGELGTSDDTTTRENFGGTTVKKPLLLNSSLASQAVGPPLSAFEMSCGAAPARNFPELGRKLLRLRPLAFQEVAVDDSVLGSMRYVTGKGLRTSYGRLIMQAFDRKFWGSRALINVDGTNFRQIEYNFPLFWGLAIQLYEATLVSDETRYDVWAKGEPTPEYPNPDAAMTELEKEGLAVFSGFSGTTAAPASFTDAKCINCHVGPEFTGASVRLRACQDQDGDKEAIERMIMGNGDPAIYDGGFYNIGVRQTNEDLGVGGNGGGGAPLSFSRQATTDNVVDYFCINEAALQAGGAVLPDGADPLLNFLRPQPGERVAVDGAHKTPTIRNVELTAPYFHSGGHSTLEQVVEFYDSGAGQNGAAPGFHDENINDLDPDIQPLNLLPAEEAALVAFMKALTDERVKYEKAPFDHPQLFIPNGHPVDEDLVIEEGTSGEAQDEFIEIPAVGADGLVIAPANFLE